MSCQNTAFNQGFSYEYTLSAPTTATADATDLLLLPLLLLLQPQRLLRAAQLSALSFLLLARCLCCCCSGCVNQASGVCASFAAGAKLSWRSGSVL